MGWRVESIALGVDLERFRPVTPDQRRELRRNLGWPDGARVALHVGHLRSGRGLDLLAQLGGEEGWHPVVIASTSTPVETAVLDQLHRSGVELRREYDPHVERFYQAALEHTRELSGAARAS